MSGTGNLNEKITAMTCDEARSQFAFMLYGELSFDEEERVESHLDVCEGCRTGLEAQKRLHEALDSTAVTPSPALLERCRADLDAALDQEQFAAARRKSDAVDRQAKLDDRGFAIWQKIAAAMHVPALKPVGALTLIAIGFLAARLMPNLSVGSGGYQAADIVGLGAGHVRSIAAKGDGRVEIVVDETRPRTVMGTLDDRAIRNLLLSAAKESADPGLRAQTVGLLVNGAQAEDVREALVFALEHDQNSAIRLRAMEGLKSYTADHAVQEALAQVLLRDANDGVRTQAIDLLTSTGGDEVDQQIIGVLQEIVSREDNAYVRERCARLLRAVKASSEIY